MPLERYLKEGNIELLKRKVESSTEIQLKLIPRWLITKPCLQKQQETSNQRNSAIIMTINSKSKFKKLCASGL